MEIFLNNGIIPPQEDNIMSQRVFHMLIKRTFENKKRCMNTHGGCVLLFKYHISKLGVCVDNAEPDTGGDTKLGKHADINKYICKLMSHICILLKVSCLQYLANNLQDYKYI